MIAIDTRRRPCRDPRRDDDASLTPSCSSHTRREACSEAVPGRPYILKTSVKDASESSNDVKNHFLDDLFVNVYFACVVTLAASDEAECNSGFLAAFFRDSYKSTECVLHEGDILLA